METICSEEVADLRGSGRKLKKIGSHGSYNSIWGQLRGDGPLI